MQQSIFYKRVLEHKIGAFEGSFTLKYNVHKLVYFECFSITGDAFLREKQIKAGSRKKKIELIESINAEWKDLSGVSNENKGDEFIRLKKFLR